MYLTINTFYVGLTVGLLVGITFHSIMNYVFKNKCKRNTSHAIFQQKSNSSVKENGEFKIVLLVRQDLKMGKGKVAAQCSHAIVHCYEKGLKYYPKEISAWESNNKLVNVFKVSDEETMLKYEKMAKEIGYNSHIVIDAGRTQVAPSSKTVMAIGPAKNDLIDLFTNSLLKY